MIVDISQELGKLEVSYIGEEGELRLLQLDIPASEQYIWDYANPAQRKDPNFKSWDNKPVKKTKSKFLNKYRIQEFLLNQPKHIKDKLYAKHLPKMFFCDIETEVTDDGFPEPKQAKNAVTAIAFSTGNKIIALGTKKLTTNEILGIKEKINVYFKDFRSEIDFNYLYFETEFDMLYSFMGKATHKMPLITGWNFIRFDWEYLLNRCKRLNIDPAISSPRNELTYKNLPLHRIIVDYLEIYKKWDKSIDVKENNSLNFVSQEVLGIKKINYSGSLQDLYEQDFAKYIYYNAVDTYLVQLIHEKLQTIQTFFTLGILTGVELQKVYSPINMAETAMLAEFYKRGCIFPRVKKSNDNEKKGYKGAFVFKPKPDMYEWIAAFDFASLYPSIMRQFNISPENYIKNIEPGEEIEVGQVVTKSGAVFDDTEDSVFRTVLTEYYAKRKEAKGEMFAIEQEIDFLKKYIHQ